MLSLKKVYRDELLQLALILSLLRSHPDSYFDRDSNEYPVDNYDLENGTSWRSLATNALRAHYVHPKNFDSVLLNYEREVFADINALGRYNRLEETIRRPNITAYLLNVDRTSSPVTVGEPVGDVLLHPQPPPLPLPPDPLILESRGGLHDVGENGFDSGIELTQEDMDLIEVLWKQDVDLGFSLDPSPPPKAAVVSTAATAGATVLPPKGDEGDHVKATAATTSMSGYRSPSRNDDDIEDNIEKLKALKEINDDNIKVEPEPQDLDPWAGLNYTIDTETGEYVIKGELEESGADCGPSCDPLGDLSLPLPEFLLEEALQLVGLDDDISQETVDDCSPRNGDSLLDGSSPASSSSSSSSRRRGGDDDAFLSRTSISFGDYDDNDDEQLVGCAKAGADDGVVEPQPGSIASALLDAAAVVAGGSTTSAEPLHSAGNDDDEEDEDLRLFETMIQTSQFHHPHHSRAFQSRMPFVRAVSIEQHWQDLANLLSAAAPPPPPPPTSGAPGGHPHHHHHQQSTLSHPHPHHHHHAVPTDYHHHHYGGSGPAGPTAGGYLQGPPPPPPPPHAGNLHHHHMGHMGGMGGSGGGGGLMGGSGNVTGAYCGGESARNVLLHNATLNPPIGELNGTSMTYGNLGGTNLGNAVATSMNLTNSSEPMGESGPGPHYKLEPSHDLLYYQNSTSELNQTDGLLSSILNDEDLQLMDMAMNEGMYTMRMLDTGANATSPIGGGVATSSQQQHLASASAAAAAAAAANAASGGGPSAIGGPGSVGGAAGGPRSQGSATRGPTDMDRLDTSSDSAVSSMGSERVPSLSDGEWGDGGSDSGHTAGDHYVTDYHRKFGPYDYSYSSRQHSGSMSGAEARIPPVAQKKHQMYGKRYFQEQSGSLPPAATSTAPTPPVPIKYEYRDPCNGGPATATAAYHHPAAAAAAAAAAAHHMDGSGGGPVGSKAPLDIKYYGGHGHPASAAAATSSSHNGLGLGLSLHHHHHLSQHAAAMGLDHVQHNHTYHLPVVSSTGAMQRPVSRDKAALAAAAAAKARKAEEEHLTRDEKRARTLSVPISVDDIINLPMDEFNERLSKYDLSETQLSLIRDIRRRGKNKVAAQNCRKRKLDQILTLADEVKEMRDRKIRLVNDHAFVSSESIRIKEKYQQLYRHVFQNLRDADGNHYSPYQYSLQTSADGSILVVPLSSTSSNNLPDRKEPQPPQKD